MLRGGPGVVTRSRAPRGGRCDNSHAPVTAPPPHAHRVTRTRRDPEARSAPPSQPLPALPTPWYLSSTASSHFHRARVCPSESRPQPRKTPSPTPPLSPGPSPERPLGLRRRERASTSGLQLAQYLAKRRRAYGQVKMLIQSGRVGVQGPLAEPAQEPGSEAHPADPHSARLTT